MNELKENSMSEVENVETMKQFYAAFLAGDMAQVLSLVTDDFVLSNDFTANVATAGEFNGKAGLEKFFALLGDVVSEVESFVADEFVAGGDEGESVVLDGDEFIDIAVTRDPSGGGDAPVRRVAGLVVDGRQRQMAR